MNAASEPAPRIAGLIAASGVDATGLDGVAATEREYLVEVERTVEMYARTLARLHSTPLDGAEGQEATPAASAAPDDLVSSARHALEHGDITSDSLSAPYRHVTPGRLVELFAQGRPAEPDEWVLCHGRPELTRLRCSAGEALGFVEWERACLSDPYLDLAVAARDVATRLSPVLVPALLDSYTAARGRSGRPDAVRLDWYALAAELQR